MCDIDNFFQNLRDIPEPIRTPNISDKEIEQMVKNMLIANENKHVVRIGMR